MVGLALGPVIRRMPWFSVLTGVLNALKPPRLLQDIQQVAILTVNC